MCVYAVADQLRRWFTGARHINIYYRFQVIEINSEWFRLIQSSSGWFGLNQIKLSGKSIGKCGFSVF